MKSSFCKTLSQLFLIVFQGSVLFGQSVDITKMVTDYERPYIYAINGSNVSQDTLLIISVESEQVIKTIPVGDGVTDMTIHYGEGRLYITNWLHAATQVVDLETQTLLPPLSLGLDVFKINAGRVGRLYYEEEDQWIDIKVINTSTGDEVGRIFVREGDGEIDPTGKFYYHCDNNISNAHIQKYDISTDTPVALERSLQHPFGSRNLILSGDGSRLFWRGYIYNSNLDELGQLGEEIYGATLHGGLAFGKSNVYNTRTGNVIHTLSFSSSVLAVSGDQTKLFAYDSVQQQIVVVPMSSISDIPSSGANPSPSNGDTIVLPLDSLAWDLNPLVLYYQVYFGSDSLSVASADTNSLEYLGSADLGAIALSRTLDLGSKYYWRVDMVGFSATIPGEIWSFTASPVLISPKRIDMRMVTNSPDQLVDLILSTGSQILSWSVTESIPWLTLDRSSGQTPDTLTVTFNIGVLTAGAYSDTLRFTSDGREFSVPVSLELFTMDLTKMVTDYERPYVYALHRGSGGFDDAFLLFISTETDLVVKVLPIGSNPTDMTIHYGEGRLYVTNWLHAATQVVDLETQTLLPSLSLGPDVFKINAGRVGRLYYEEEDQWIDIKVINTSTGDEVGRIFVREGDGEIDPTGDFYYHCDNNSSAAKIHKYDISTDAASEVASSVVHAFGSRNLILSGDGSRLFWRGYAYDSDLNELVRLGEEIYSTTLRGELAFGSLNVFDGFTGDRITSLPITSQVMAVSGDQAKLVMYDGTSGSILVQNIEELLLQTFVSQGQAIIPEVYSLAQNYPNPFNPVTKITFSLPAKSHVNLEIFNVLGQRIQTLVNEDKSAGSYAIIWDGREQNGGQVASGIYFYRLVAGDYVQSRKMLLMK